MRENIRRTGLSIGLSLIVVTMLIPGVGIVQADDEWPSKCNKNTPLVETGTYSGSLSPDDRDTLRIDLDKGDYASIQLLYTPPDQAVQMAGEQETTTAATDVAPLWVRVDQRTRRSVQDRGRFTYKGFTSQTGGEFDKVSGVSVNNPGYMLRTTDVEFRIYAEQNKPLCLILETRQQTAGEWKIALAKNDVQPQKIGTDAIVAQQELEQRVDHLENRIVELEQRVTTVESQLNALNNSTTAQRG